MTRRSKSTGMVFYGFGNASGRGFGNCLSINGVNHLKYGTWTLQYEGLHSNFKELKNLVNAVTEASQEGLLVNAKRFLFTDNVVAEWRFK